MTVLFADISGFTEYAARVTPEELVQRLGDIFNEFDVLADRHGLEKIKTIGDAYMVAAGVPDSVPDHAGRTAAFALDMITALDRVNLRIGEQFAIRVGLHSGPVVAGVIGKRKFSYDLWGDTVNTASRMESHGAAGRVHASAATARALADDDRFVISERGEIAIKGKGAMRTYFVAAGRT